MILRKIRSFIKYRKSVSDNKTYPDFCLKASSDDTVFNTFRNNEIYKNILEHVDDELAYKYWVLLQEKYNLEPDDIYSSIKKLNSIGSPNLIKIDKSIPEISSTALRYLYTGLEIKNFVDNNNLKSRRIIELGCGYGGQSIILQDLIGIDTYTYVDLSEVNLLINKFISYFELDFETSFTTLEGTFEDNYDLFISNYSFSELPLNLQKIGIKKIINSCMSGYMIINSENFNKNYKFMKKNDYERLFKSFEINTENPQSSRLNVNYVYKFINKL